jgi:hypothetical protein
MAKKRDMINNNQKLRGPKSANKNLKAKRDGMFSFFSDGLKFFNDLGGFFDDDDDDDFFGFNSNKNTSSSSSKNNNPFSNFGYGGYNYGNYGYNNYGYNYGYNNNYGYNYGYNYNNNYNNNNFVPKKKEEPKYVYDPVKYKAAQKNWKEFSEGIKSINGVYLLQTIGSIIKALRVLNEDDTGKNPISLTERIKLYKLLESNEAIINFLTQERPKKEDDDDEPEETEDILVPDEHPEETTSLEELEQKISDLKIQLNKKNLKPEDRKKLEKLYNFYLQQKNILIENETNKKKNEIINQNEINVQERRRKLKKKKKNVSRNYKDRKKPKKKLRV